MSTGKHDNPALYLPDILVALTLLQGAINMLYINLNGEEGVVVGTACHIQVQNDLNN